MGDSCKNGEGCIFLSKDLGWLPYDAKNTRSAAPKPIDERWKDTKTTLLISISSFRDALCPKTLYNLFTKAQYPDRITVSIIQQNVHGEDVDCLDTYCEMMGKKDCPHKDQVLIKRVNAKDARGPQWARAEASKVILGRPAGADEFCLQIDSHMDFVHGFDSKMMEMWALTDNEYGILSTYVTASENLPLFEGENAKGVNNMHEVPHLCMITLQGANGMPRNWGTKCARSLPHPKLTNGIWGAGLSFSKCHAERKVPYDPHLPYIFDGEEFSRSVRFFTWGYDVYTPHRVYIVHDYTNSQKDPLHFAWTRNHGSTKGGRAVGAHLHPYDAVDNDDGRTASDSVKRIQRLLGRTYSNSREQKIYRQNKEQEDEERRRVQWTRYGLGDRRTLEQAATFTGVDMEHWHVDNRKNNRCGNLNYVPFKEHPRGAAYEPRYDPVSEVFIDEKDEGSIRPLLGEDAQYTRKEGDAKKNEISPPLVVPPFGATAQRHPLLSTSLDLSSHPHAIYFRLAQGLCFLVIIFVLAAGLHSFLRRRSNSRRTTE